MHPGLEHVVDPTTKAGQQLLSRYVTPAELRRGGAARVARHLRAAGIPRAERVAARALESAQEQRIVLPAEAVTAALVKERSALSGRDGDDVKEFDGLVGVGREGFLCAHHGDSAADVSGERLYFFQRG